METGQKQIILFYTNEIYLLNPENFNGVIGIFTEGLATCSSIIISFQNDKYVLFCHFNEEYDLLKECINIINEEKHKMNEKISEINVFYSQGIGPLKNEKIDHNNINKLIKYFITYFNINENDIHLFIKKHDYPVSVLKIFSENNDEFSNILNKTHNNLKNQCNKKFLPKSMETFMMEKKDIHSKFLISYYFNKDLLFKIISSLDYNFINELDN